MAGDMVCPRRTELVVCNRRICSPKTSCLTLCFPCGDNVFAKTKAQFYRAAEVCRKHAPSSRRSNTASLASTVTRAPWERTCYSRVSFIRIIAAAAVLVGGASVQMSFPAHMPLAAPSTPPPPLPTVACEFRRDFNYTDEGFHQDGLAWHFEDGHRCVKVAIAS